MEILLWKFYFVRSDKRGASQGTGPSLHEQQCCQAAQRRGSFEARGNKEMRLVTVALQAPPVIKIQQQENRAISNRDVEQLCALIL